MTAGRPVTNKAKEACPRTAHHKTMSDSDSSSNKTSEPRVYKIMLTVLPVGVVVGTVIFMFMYFYLEREEEKKQTVIVSHGLRLDDLEDMVAKFAERIGERSVETEQGRLGLRSAASMIEGRLGPLNVGYPVNKCEGEAAHGFLWKSLSVEIAGTDRPREVVFAAVSYAGSGEIAEANTIATMTMLASSMAREQPARTIRFVFLPFDRPPSQQDRWLLERCLQPGEDCAGIIGLSVMKTAPATGEPAWKATVTGAASEAWWAYLSKGKTNGEFDGGTTTSVWLSHPVFSPVTWQGKAGERLDRTMEVAQDLRRWLLKAAE
jgi:hypothetical protein